MGDLINETEKLRELLQKVTELCSDFCVSPSMVMSTGINLSRRYARVYDPLRGVLLLHLGVCQNAEAHYVRLYGLYASARLLCKLAQATLIVCRGIVHKHKHH